MFDSTVVFTLSVMLTTGYATLLATNGSNAKLSTVTSARAKVSGVPELGWSVTRALAFSSVKVSVLNVVSTWSLETTWAMAYLSSFPRLLLSLLVLRRLRRQLVQMLHYLQLLVLVSRCPA